jgi:hypothetical protein
MYKKNQRHLEANNMILKNNSCSKSEIHLDVYETCTPFKSKSTILANEDSSNIKTLTVVILFRKIKST